MYEHTRSIVPAYSSCTEDTRVVYTGTNQCIQCTASMSSTWEAHTHKSGLVRHTQVASITIVYCIIVFFPALHTSNTWIVATQHFCSSSGPQLTSHTHKFVISEIYFKFRKLISKLKCEASTLKILTKVFQISYVHDFSVTDPLNMTI